MDILAHPAPVLALDTCAVLDLVRSQQRLQAPARLIEMALGAIGAATASPPRLHMIAIEQVETECKKNLPSELMDLERHFRTLRQTGSTLLRKSQAASWQAELFAIRIALSSLPDALISASLRIKHDAVCSTKANLRLANGTAPGRRGSKNVGDCVIVEHILELSKRLRARSYTQPIQFVSSNIKDFGPIGQPKPPLDADFAVLGIDLFPDIEAAMISLGF